MIFLCNSIFSFSYLILRIAACLIIFSLICLGFLPLFFPNFLPIFNGIPVAINFFLEMLPGFRPLFFFNTTSSPSNTSIVLLFNSGGITTSYTCCNYSESLAAVVPLTFFSIYMEGVWDNNSFFCSRFSFSSCFRLISNSRFKNKSSNCCIFFASRSRMSGLF